jgi:hypothetical protein
MYPDVQLKEQCLLTAILAELHGGPSPKHRAVVSLGTVRLAHGLYSTSLPTSLYQPFMF